MIQNLLRRLLGSIQPQSLQDEPAIEAQKGSPSSDSESRTYSTRINLPLAASLNPDDRQHSAQFMQQYSVVPANDRSSMLVFSDYFVSETPEGEVVYDDWTMEADERQGIKNHRVRLKDTIRIYEHLFRNRAPHPRVVRYLGPTHTGYRLERFSPGHVLTELPDSDAMLALYQRWALQVLSGLHWIHARGVTLQNGAIQQEAFWLRPDYSIAIAGLVSAGCLELGIHACYWPSHHFTNPWGQQMSFSFEPCDWRATGLTRGDIVDWATWVYQLMTDKTNPLEHDVGTIFGVHNENAEAWSNELSRREHQAEEGTFENWPLLPKDKLGPVLVRAWSGQYQFAHAALEDARKLLEECGRELSLFQVDEIDGFDWPALFEIGKDKYGNNIIRSKVELEKLPALSEVKNPAHAKKQKIPEVMELSEKDD